MSDVVTALAAIGIRPRSGAFAVGRNSYTTCPNCSAARSHPSNRSKPCLSVMLDAEGGAVYFCNHCNWSGNVPGKRAEGQSYRAPPVKPVKAARERPADPKLDNAAKKFLLGRHIPIELAREMGLYSAPIKFPQDMDKGATADGVDWKKVPTTSCLAFPYFLDGVVTNHKYRDAEKRFCQDPQALRSLYNADQIADDELIFVEGEMDVLALMACGYKSVVTLPDGGHQKRREENDPQRDQDARYKGLDPSIKKLHGLKKIILATDSDAVGDNLADELARRLGREKCWRVRWPVPKDANDCLMALGPDAVRAAIDNAKPYPTEGAYQLEAGALIRLRSGPRIKTFSTGWSALNQHVRVPAGGRVFIVTGIPNHGKSEIVDALLVNTAREHGWHAIVVSPENNPVELHAAKIAEKWAGEPFEYEHGAPAVMSDETVSAAEDWIRRHFTFLRRDKPGEPLTIEWVLKAASLVVLQCGSRWLVLDPWNRFQHQRPNSSNETEHVATILDMVAQWAASHNCNVIIVAHPQKLYRDKDSKKYFVPGGYDISGSANFFNIADFGLTAYRPDLNSPDVEIHIWKVRFKRHGKRGTVKLRWDRSTGRYSEIPAEETMSKRDLLRHSEPAED